MENCQNNIGDGFEAIKKDGNSDNYNESSKELLVKGSTNSKNLPNGCVKHTLEDNGLVKLVQGRLESDSSNGRTLHDKDVCEGTSSKVESVKKDSQNAIVDHTCDNADASPMHTASQNQSECDMDSADIDGDLTTSSEGATDSVSTAMSRVSISDTDSSSRTDSESKPRRPLTCVIYESEEQMPDIMRLITKDLSEPYSIYTYRYFIHNWPKLCFLVGIWKSSIMVVNVSAADTRFCEIKVHNFEINLTEEGVALM